MASSAMTASPGPGVPGAVAGEQRLILPAKALPGTYQFVISDQENQEVFTEDILIVIEQLRSDTETIVYQVTEKVSVKILSRKEISQPGFQPLPEILMNDFYEKR